MSQQFSLKNIHVVPNGVYAEDYLRFDQHTKELMNKLDIKYRDLVILIPVRVTPRKNLEFALDIIYELKRLLYGERNVKVLITGPPDHQAITMGVAYLKYLDIKIKELGLEDNICFCHEFIDYKRSFVEGRIVKWNIADAYTISDLVLVPSKEEGFGLPLIEAGAARKMVFASKIPPFEELIEQGISGHLFDLDESPKDVAYMIFKEFDLQAFDTNVLNVVKNIAYKIYKMLLMDFVEPSFGSIAKNMLFEMYKMLVMNIVDPNFNSVMDNFRWNIILRKKLLPLL
ncbi:MAG: glycosyltransferase family 4 protein [Nitrososphaeria archaeon]|nr:glycosyltransferase family 4 protein [Nitrososphaeria archaeon]